MLRTIQLKSCHKYQGGAVLNRGITKTNILLRRFQRMHVFCLLYDCH